MSLETYITLTRYFTCTVFSFFAYQFISSIFNYSKHLIKSSIWHSLMCLTTALYCFVVAINSHYFNQTLSNSLLSVFWILAYTSYFCYLKAVEVYLNKDIRLLRVSKAYCLFLSIMHLFNILSISIFNFNFLFKSNPNQETYFAKTMSFTISPNLFSLALGGVGALIVLYSSVLIWKELKKLNKKETLLQIGIIVSFFSVFNDTALGLELSGALLPLYFLGNSFEAARLNFHYQRVAYEKLNRLEGEVDQLAKVAQFGYAAANISHDIKNHLTIIKLSLRKVSQVHDGPEIKKSLRYINQISDITKVYTDLFKYNSSLECQQLNLKTIVSEAKDLVKDRIDKANINLSVNLEENINIKANQIALTLCLVNLLGNSIDEVTKQDDKWIRVDYCNEDKKLLLVDSGKGIPKHIAEHIFEVSYSTKKAKGGSGLGLAISKHLMSKSGLEISLDTARANTTFVIDFSSSEIS